MITFIDDNRASYGVEPICRVLPIAPPTYHERVVQRQDSTRLSARARQDMALKPEIARVFAENFEVYGVRKVWRQMMREGVSVARCTVERLMRDMGTLEQALHDRRPFIAAAWFTIAIADRNMCPSSTPKLASNPAMCGLPQPNRRALRAAAPDIRRRGTCP